MDNKYMTERTIISFPVLVKEALLSIGNTHAAQGDGEISVTRIEALMRIVYQGDVIKGDRKLSEPPVRDR